MGKVTEFPLGGSFGSKRFVRITNPDRKGFVEFNFSIGDPTIYLEMILDKPAFEAFCKEEGTVFLTPEQELVVDDLDARWHGKTEMGPRRTQ